MTRPLTLPAPTVPMPSTTHPLVLPRWALLVTGAVLVLLSGYRWGVPALAWLAPVPFLLYARTARGLRAWLGLIGVLSAAYTLQIMSLLTAPMPKVLALVFSLPTALGMALMLGVTETVRRRSGDLVGLWSFVALCALFDWLGYGLSDLGAWSSAANSQVHALAFVQLASVTGLAGLSLLMAATAATMAQVLAVNTRAAWLQLGVVTALVLAALVWGSLRLDSPKIAPRTVQVAAVVTDLGPDARGGLPSDAALAANTDLLFARTALAARRGARLVVWNEVAALVRPTGERPLVERVRIEARRLGVDIVAAYGVLLSTKPLLFDNKYVFVSDKGDVVQTYRKHRPVPGEPSLRGTEPLSVVDRPYARVSGAICYDYDFPAIAREHARLGAELVVVPASDWRGIDPVHTMMTRIRAVEGGFSVLRATRWATSAGFDAQGRVRGMLSAVEPNDRVLVTALPVTRVQTPYARLGDAPIVSAASLWLLVAAWLTTRPRRRPR